MKFELAHVDWSIARNASDSSSGFPTFFATTITWGRRCSEESLPKLYFPHGKAELPRKAHGKYGRVIKIVFAKCIAIWAFPKNYPTVHFLPCAEAAKSNPGLAELCIRRRRNLWVWEEKFDNSVSLRGLPSRSARTYAWDICCVAIGW